MQATTLDGWFVGWLPDLNQRDPEVAKYEIQNTLWWVDNTGIDGIREDTHALRPARLLAKVEWPDSPGASGCQCGRRGLEW